MATEVIMPKMGYDVTEAKLSRWLKEEGDQVERGEPVAVIETDKVDIEIEAFTDGVLRKILMDAGKMVPVGTPMAIIADEDEEVNLEAYKAGEVELEAEEAEAAPEDEEAEEEKKEEAPPARAEPSRDGTGEIVATPLARRMAKEEGIDLQEVKGTGPGGRIGKADIEAYLKEREEAPALVAEPAAAPAPRGEVERIELDRMRRTIARRMTQSKQNVPHFYITMDVEMDAALALRKQLNEELPEEQKISINDMVVKACALALRTHPEMNASFNAEEEVIDRHPQVDVGVAVAIEGGLITPAIRNADVLPLNTLAATTKIMAERARDGKLHPDDIGGTFTVSNLGMFGVENFIAIVNPPQAGILAVGSVEKRPVVRDDGIKTPSMMKITLSADHRAVDGVQGALFSREVKRLLESPMQLLLGAAPRQD